MMRTSYKAPLGTTPYKLVYGKSCHLSVEIEHKAWLAMQHLNLEDGPTGEKIMAQLRELKELRLNAHNNNMIYKEKVKRWHSQHIMKRVFKVGDKVLLFNSRLKLFSGKLKFKWSGPFEIVEVLSYCLVTIRLQRKILCECS